MDLLGFAFVISEIDRLAVPNDRDQHLSRYLDPEINSG
jgi:hypothetical protein